MLIAVLAAGLSKRFKGCKLIHNFQGKPLIHHTLMSLPDGIEALVITGAYREDVENCIKSFNIKSIFNPNFAQGIGTSITVAAQQASLSKTDLLITLGDLPFVTKSNYNDLINYFNNKPLFACFDDTYGPPAIIPYKELDRLKNLKKDTGAKKLFKVYDTFPLKNAKKDIDHNAALKTLKSSI